MKMNDLVSLFSKCSRIERKVKLFHRLWIVIRVPLQSPAIWAFYGLFFSSWVFLPCNLFSLRSYLERVTASHGCGACSNACWWYPCWWPWYFYFWAINIVIPSGDSNLGPKPLSTLEFETWWLRLLGHHGRLQYGLFKWTKLGESVTDNTIILGDFNLALDLNKKKSTLCKETIGDDNEKSLRSLLNKFHEINNKIYNKWLDLSLNTFKIKCKQLFVNRSKIIV